MINAELYRKWLDEHGLTGAAAIVRRRGRDVAVPLPSPDERGLFWRGATPCVLPYLRVFWKRNPKSGGGAAPPWLPQTWTQLGDGDLGLAKAAPGGGFVRFLRADQLLDCLKHLVARGDDPAPLVDALRTTLGTWLVPLDEPLRERLEILERRVETVRLGSRGDQWSWSRNHKLFPDDLRMSLVDGIDPVHTPESARAGLTRYLCEGWTVGDEGRLVAGSGASAWGPSTTHIPHRRHDGPRRLMLGASLQARSVSLVASDRPPVAAGEGTWTPPGRLLRASFAMREGWTHEDALVISETAAAKLECRTTRITRVLIPSVATRVELGGVDAGAVEVAHGHALARAYIDAFALGLRRHDAERDGAKDGWVEVALPAAVAPFAGKVARVTRQVIRTPFWREMITFEIERTSRVQVGDKLSTRHGIKGVVSRILPDAEMPPTPDGPAEIVLSPLGIVRRGAMGQLREASKPDATVHPRAGTIFVMRQPQDAALPERCRVRGAERRGMHLHNGQRYGEMEQWALMAHGAAAIAKELLSARRSIAPWMEWEAKLGSGEYRTLATRALNRYLAIANVQIHAGNFVVDKEPLGVFEIAAKWSGRGDPRDQLDDAKYFCSRGGLGKLALGRKVRVVVGDHDDRNAPVLELDHVYILPPWLRPSSAFQRNELTRAYWMLMTRLAWFQSKPSAIEDAVRKVVMLTLDARKGAGGFLRREVLGRRLTRSARAVIVPRPDLRIDQIAIPAWMAKELFEDLSDAARQLVLVNRNPTLHRRGLLALRPLIDPPGGPQVFGLPLGILQVLGADFDGDQATVVALETEAALREAERLLPGSEGLRLDKFRPLRPMFPFAGELADRPQELARVAGASTQEAWCEAHAALQRDRLSQLGDGWSHPLVRAAIEGGEKLWRGIATDVEWRKLAVDDMETVLRGVRRKGELGGVLRRQLYRRTFDGDQTSFARVVQALQSVTETMTQTALSVKSGPGATEFDADGYFEAPLDRTELLAALDLSARRADCPLDANVIGTLLAASREPRGLLAWMARPDAATLHAQRSVSDSADSDDPRVSWFLA